jgi:hypothetical protein
MRPLQICIAPALSTTRASENWFKDRVKADPKFAEALFREGVDAMLSFRRQSEGKLQ